MQLSGYCAFKQCCSEEGELWESDVPGFGPQPLERVYGFIIQHRAKGQGAEAKWFGQEEHYKDALDALLAGTRYLCSIGLK